MCSHIVNRSVPETIQIVGHVLQFFVPIVVVIRENRHTVIDIESVRETAIVYDNHFTRRYVFYHP
jgi:hypothetical protein